MLEVLTFATAGAEDSENELGVLEFIHALVETLDKYFESARRGAGDFCRVS